MHIRLDKAQIELFAEKAFFRIQPRELRDFERVCDSLMARVEALDLRPAGTPMNCKAVRDTGVKPTSAEDPYNAIVRRCHVKSDSVGLLSGKRVGLKDCIAVAGIPMTCGSRMLAGYIPTTDSVVVERLLSEGAEICGMLNMDCFAISGSGDTSDYGPVINPFDGTRTAGGSSGGSAAALFYEDFDLAFGADQGGSIRIPASWCGTLGLKPTYGLVPYTGIVGHDLTYDHVGPLARTVEDLAVALQAVAGIHPSDPRQGHVLPEDYVAAVANAPSDLRGVRIGVLSEAFSDAVGVEEATARAAMEAVRRLQGIGAEVVQISIPEHLTAGDVVICCALEGLTATYFGSGNGYHWLGRYAPDFALAIGGAARRAGNDLPAALKSVLIVGAYLRDNRFGTIYGKAQNLRVPMGIAYDRPFEDVDFMVLPTATVRAQKVDLNVGLADAVLRGWSMLGNTAPFNLTGHPALSMPAGEADGLPVGLMVVGKRGADASVLRLAKAYEASYSWYPKR
jgi:amidase